MYGYIRFYADELKMKDLALFKAYYCGLCHQLKEDYGEKARLFLSYDMTFMAIFLDALSEDEPQQGKGFCPVSPWRKKNMILKKDSVIKSALLTIIMGYYKLEDAWRDDKAYSAGLAMFLYRKAFVKAQNRHSETALLTENHLKQFYAGEKQEKQDLDSLVHPFAQLVGDIMSLNSPPQLKNDLHKLGYHAGRWLYFIDALDDLPEDMAEKKFNAFTATLPYEANQWPDFFRQAEEDIYANLFFSLEEICKIFTELPLKRNQELLENIFFLGIRGVTEKIMAQRQKGDATKFATPFKLRTSCSNHGTIKE